MCSMKQFWTRNCHSVDGSSSEDPHLSSVWRIFCTRLSVQSSQWWASAGLFAVIFIVIISYLKIDQQFFCTWGTFEKDQIFSNLILSHLYKAFVGGGSVKAVIMDSVSAVISPLLGGKQNEGDISFCLSIIPEAVFTP